LSAARSWAE